MEAIKEQVNELTENQKHMLQAIRYLNDRMDAITDEAHNDQNNDVKDMIKSQEMINEIMIRSEFIKRRQKVKS